jgi:hypothetical protein
VHDETLKDDRLAVQILIREPVCAGTVGRDLEEVNLVSLGRKYNMIAQRKNATCQPP